MYYIAKRGYGDGLHVVTRILRGGLSIDNRYVHGPQDRLRPSMLCRAFKTESAARGALAKMQRVGGFDDYQIFNPAEID